MVNSRAGIEKCIRRIWNIFMHQKVRGHSKNYEEVSKKHLLLRCPGLKGLSLAKSVAR
jgi:hypothetical protein